MLGEDIADEVLKVVNSGTIPPKWNDTTIVLILRINIVKKVTRFRPIGLCNVVHKVISKMLAARLEVFFTRHY